MDKPSDIFVVGRLRDEGTIGKVFDESIAQLCKPNSLLLIRAHDQHRGMGERGWIDLGDRGFFNMFMDQIHEAPNVLWRNERSQRVHVA